MRLSPFSLAIPLLCLSGMTASAFTPYTASQLVYINVDHAPEGAYSTFAYGVKGSQCGLETSSASIPYAGGGGGVIVALSGPGGLQALPFVAGTSSIASNATFFADANVQRTLGPCTDQWSVPSAGLAFTHYTPAWSMADINTATLAEKKRFFLPATWMTFTIANTSSQREDFYFGLPVSASRQSFAGGAYQGFTTGEAALAVQNGSCELLSGSGLSAALNGVTTGFAFHLSVPPGVTRSLNVAVAFYRSAVVDTRIGASYYYTSLFSGFDSVLDAAFAEYPDALTRCQQLASAMQNANLNVYRQFLACEALHSYQCNTNCLIDGQNKVYWRETEGAYENINTLDLTADHAFYDCVMHPWVLRNILDAFSGASNNGNGYTFTHPLYNESTGVQVSANGFSFQHEMGNGNGLVSNDPATDPTEYETVFSYMGQEELDNWIVSAGLYWTHSGDNSWVSNNSAMLKTCLNSLLLRDDTNAATRDGVTSYLNFSPQSGHYEITTYDSLDPSLQDPHNGAYTASKNWAAYLALQAMFTQIGDTADASTAQSQAALAAQSITNGFNATLGYIPAALSGSNTSATLPILEGVSLANWMGFTTATNMQTGPYAAMLQKLRQHCISVLTPGLCLDSTTGSLKITSANTNTFPSKEFIAQYAAETVLGVTGDRVDGLVDQVNATLQMQQSDYQGLSDQINAPGGNFTANSSLHYPRGITSALFWLTPANSPVFPTPSAAPAAPVALDAIPGNGQAVLYWGSSAQATAGYTIERGTVNGGPYSIVASNVTGASYTDTGLTNGVTYYYEVVAANAIGNSAPSTQVSVQPSASSPLIDVQFGASPAQTGAAVLGMAGDAWNALTSSSGALVSSTGSSLGGIGLTLSDVGNFTNSNGTAMDAATTALMENYAFAYGSTPTVNISISGLSAYVGSAFSLVLYGAGDTSGQGATFTLSGATGGNSASTLSTSATSRQISQGAGVAYQIFSGTIASSTLTITAAINPGQMFVVVNGLQLQLTAPGGVTPVGSNSGFETPALGANQYQYNPAGAVWTFSAQSGANGSGVTANSSAFTAANAPAPEGNQVAFLQGVASISRTLTGLTPGANYTVTFAAAQRTGNQSGAQTWNVTLDGTTLAKFNPGASATYFSDYSVSFVATATSQTLAFAGTNLNTGDNTVFIDNVRLASGPLTFTAYQQQYFTPAQQANAAISGPAADANGDGISNLLAAALGLNPNAAASGSLPALASSGGHLTLTFTRPTGQTAWTTAVQVSSDLVNWQSGASYTTTLSANALSANLEQDTVEDNTPMTGNAPRFMRLKVTLP